MKQKLRSGIYNGLGGLCVALGVIGIFLPLMPTTIFLILAAFFFSRGSERYHRWLLYHPRFGQYIRDYQQGLGMPFKCKCIAIGMIWLSIGFSALFVIELLWLQLLLLTIASALTIYLCSLPTRSTCD